MDISQLVAIKRFGVGLSPSGELPNDPVAWLKTQLAAPDPARFALPSTGKCMNRWREDTLHPLPPLRILHGLIVKSAAAERPGR
jgi:hypothetical protein